MMSKFEIEIVSLPCREDLVAEIFYDDMQWVQIYKNKNEIFIQFYSNKKNEFWEFPLNEAMQILEEAKNKLLTIG